MKKISLLTALFCVAGAALGQGSLTPPGFPAPTMKTLAELDVSITQVSNLVKQVGADLDVMIDDISHTVRRIEDAARIDIATVAGDSGYHHVISHPGSYYLTRNLEVTKSNGISITASGVTLDLNGFQIARTSGTGGYGIYIDEGNDYPTLRNGSIVGFEYGIQNYGKNGLFEKLVASECTTVGIYASGNSSRLVDCRALNNSGSGIYAGAGSSLQGCTASGNHSIYGILADAGSSLIGCTAYGNQGTYGIYASTGSSLSSCTAYGNHGTGIYAGDGSSLNDCTATANQGSYGIYAGDGSSLSGCTASSNQGNYGIHAVGSSLTGCVASYNHSNYGIHASIGSTLNGCSAFFNRGSGLGSYGIYVDYGSLVENCTASYNSNTNLPGTFTQGVGIYADNGSTVRGCVSISNKGDGIQVDQDCLVADNSCDGNGSNGDGAGIHARINNNRIEKNNVTESDRGIDVDVSGNFIVRNTASGNDSNWEIVSGNVCLVVVGTTGSSISGNSGGTAPGSTDPNANFTY